MIKRLFQWADKHIKLVKITSVVWIIMLLYLCLAPSPELPDDFEIPFLDKIAHFIIYFVLCTFLILIYKIQKWTRQTFILIISLFGFSLFIEIMQHVMSLGRTFSVGDLVANISGIISGIIIYPKNMYQ
jgi:Predicted integral membrane protein